MQEPQFQPEPGQIDYTNIRRAPVINCVVQYQDKILLVKRNENMRLYPGFWNGISGFLDRKEQTVIEKAKEELKEEVGIGESHILNIKEGKVFEVEDQKINKLWIVHPVLVTVNTDKIVLDWEAEEYRWMRPSEAHDCNLLPSFDRVLATFFNKPR